MKEILIDYVNIEVQVLLKGSTMFETFDDIYFVECTDSKLILHFVHSDSLSTEIIPMAQIESYRVIK